MRVVLITLSLLSGVVALAAPVWTEEDTRRAAKRLAQLRRDLKSKTDATVAHAAYTVSEARLRDLTPDLLRALAERPEPEGRTAWLVVKHLMDALIRLEASVPMKTLGRFEDGPRTSVLILAVRNGTDAYPLLRKTLAGSVRGERMRASGVAAGNVLAAAKDKSVLRLVLPHLRPVVKIVVRDHARLEGGGSSVTGHGDGWCKVPEGFPPIVWYELEFGRDRGRWSRLLARGPVEDVWYERWVDARKKFIIGDLSDKGDATEIAMGWVAQFLEVTVDELPIKRRYYGSHRWTTPTAYLAFAQERRREVRHHAETLEKTLIDAQLLTARQCASIQIEPRFEVWDGRDHKTTPLPKIPAR